MQSIFWPASGINKRFDIKGCLGGRYQDPQTLQEQFVLKDQNFINTPLNLGQHKQWQVQHIWLGDVKWEIDRC